MGAEVGSVVAHDATTYGNQFDSAQVLLAPRFVDCFLDSVCDASGTAGPFGACGCDRNRANAPSPQHLRSKIWRAAKFTRLNRLDFHRSARSGKRICRSAILRLLKMGYAA